MTERELALVPHYDKTNGYYSPLLIPGAFREWCQLFSIPISDAVLDAGCGDGRLLDHIDPPHYVGVDYSMERIAAASAKWPEREFVWSPIQSYEPDGQFGLIVAVEVLEHLEYPRQVADQLRSYLWEGGRLVATVPVNMPYEAHFHDFEWEGDVFDLLDPDAVTRHGAHFVAVWYG